MKTDKNECTRMLSEILACGLAKDYTSVSYAIWKDGEFLAYDALGTQGGPEKKPANPDCTYNVASVSKIYCTVAVMQLVEAGKLSLDRPVCEYLPRFSMPDERYRKITLRHCLNHSSGLPGTQWRNFSVTDLAGAHYYEDVYDYLSKNYLKAEPGEYSVYCNDGFTLAEMVVAQVSGETYEEYCLHHITEPIGAHSSRLSATRNPDYPLVAEKNGPAELLEIQGGGGYTTTMRDLCRFGELFLRKNDILSEESKAEMAKKQGKTFLKEDARSASYGLGWDTVCFSYPEYDLGEGVLVKGGNSFQFTTQFLVVPKYNAVLAISETHDCGLDVQETILRMFAAAMLRQGINIYRGICPVPESCIRENAGTYLTPSGIWNIHMYGAHCSITMDDTRGGHAPWQKPFSFDGERFCMEDGRTLLFEKSGENVFALSGWRGVTAPLAEKVQPAPEVSAAWKSRVGKKFIVADADPNDMVISNVMTGFSVALLKNFAGIVMLSFSGRSDSGVYDLFEAAVKPQSDSTAAGFLTTPGNPSRDLMFPIFEMRDGVEYCSVASYTYQDAQTLPVYEGQGFKDLRKGHAAYRFDCRMSVLPKVPEGARLMVLNEEMICVYDSRAMTEYHPANAGYLLLIAG